MAVSRNFRLIAGPCSAESREQVLACAAAVAGQGPDAFRAGLWKPRTRPGSFEGVGEEGIPWLLEVRDRFGMEPCTEVAGAAHVRACLDAGINRFWIGARTTVNPFLIQEIADALEGSGASVLIKNPVNPDIPLWTGAVERFAAAGVSDIGLVHRGFTPSGPMNYRNDPQWGLAVEMKSRFPGLPFYCDPSHIGGDVRFVPELSQQALDLGFDGLMLEVHPRPSEALSDACQQLDPEAFVRLLTEVLHGCGTDGDLVFEKELEVLRSRIDAMDSSLVALLSGRMELCREIGRLKRDRGVGIIQGARWENVLSRVVAEGREKGLDPAMVGNIFREIHRASVNEQNEIRKQKI